jgi:hypothetical protein
MGAVIDTMAEAPAENDSACENVTATILQCVLLQAVPESRLHLCTGYCTVAYRYSDDGTRF